jgi:hypothetical protein
MVACHKRWLHCNLANPHIPNGALIHTDDSALSVSLRVTGNRCDMMETEDECVRRVQALRSPFSHAAPEHHVAYQCQQQA